MVARSRVTQELSKTIRSQGVEEILNRASSNPVSTTVTVTGERRVERDEFR